MPAQRAWEIMATPGRKLFGVFDGARDSPRLYQRLVGSGLPMACLIGGIVPSPLAEAAPWCVQLHPGDPAGRELVERYWGEAAGIFVSAPADGHVTAVCRKLKRGLRVELPGGKRAMLRFYDPRVLRMFLPICDEEQWRTLVCLHGSVWCESENGESLLEYSLRRAQGVGAVEGVQAADGPLVSGEDHCPVMLTIRPEQLRQIDAHMMRTFQDQVLGKIAHLYPDRFRSDGEQEVRAFIQAALYKADLHGISADDDAEAFTLLVFEHGLDFEKSEERDELLRILEDGNLPGDAKVSLLRREVEGAEDPYY